MSKRNERWSDRGVDRREFFGIGMRAAAAWVALPAAALVLTACGSGEQAGEPAVSAPPSPGQEPSPAQVAATTEAVPTPAPSAGDDGGDRLVTELAAATSLVNGIQYVNESPKPDQNCGNCQLYTAGSGGRGKCQLFAQGLVKETGWCVSWVAKVS